MKLFGLFKSNSNVLTNENLQKLKEETDFKPKDIKKSHKKFNELDKNKKGFVSVDDLVSIPEVENNPLRFHIAQFMSDNSENEEISFESFIKVIDMFKNGGCKTLMEGVETDNQDKFSINNGFDYIQGYKYAVPEPIENIGKYFKQR